MNIEKYLKENNIRSTRGRKSILKILIESEEPLDAEYIYDKCRQNKEKVDLST
ncbi:Fur family transcriptional regulator, partial [Clostridium botulinum]